MNTRKPTASHRIRHFIAPSETTIDRVLSDHLKLSDSRMALLYKLGSIYRGKWRVRNNQELKKGDYLRVHIEPKRYRIPDLNWKSLVIGETADYLIANKPPKLPVHAMLDNEVENLVYQLRKHLGIPLWVTQRLDIDTEGLIVLAKNKEFQARFNKQLEQRQIEKHYRAWVLGKPPLGHVQHYMKPSQRAPKELSENAKEGWQSCELQIEKVHPLEGELVEVQIHLITGRTHQIRAQLSALGYPVLGDRLYGNAGKTLALQACKTSFVDKNENVVEYSLGVPAHWKECVPHARNEHGEVLKN